MSLLRNIASGLRSLFRRKQANHELDQELRAYLELAAEDKLKNGMTRNAALRAVRLEQGTLDLSKEAVRSACWESFLETSWQDLRHAVRLLRQSPVFTLVAIASLALGIGANTAIFQLIDAVRLRSLPVKNPSQLVTVQLADKTGIRGHQTNGYPSLTNAIWENFRDNQSVFSGVLAWDSNNFSLAPGGEARLAHGLFVSGDFFRVLGVQPFMGRVFTAADDHRGCGLPGAVVSYAFWQRELASDPSAIGRKLTLNDHLTEIIGVTSPGFFGLEVGSSYDVAVPICSQAVLWSEGTWLNEGTVWWLNVMGRLKPGATREQANMQLAVISPQIFQASLPSNYPAENVKDYLKFKLMSVPGGSGVSWLRNQYSDSLTLLLGTAGLVLLIACANLANLMLARASAREHEFAVRLAIGASRIRLIRQLISESLLLALLGGALGFALARALSEFLVASLATQGDPLFLDLKPAWPVLAFALALTTLTCLLFGLTPGLRASRVSASEAFRTTSRTSTSSRAQFGLRQMLVISQVALSFVLLVAALLFSSTLRNLLAVDPGFLQKGVLVADLDLFRRLRVPYEGRAAFKRDLLNRIRSLPGVVSAGEVAMLPLSGGSTSNAVWIKGSNPTSGLESRFNSISDGYFKAMGVPLRAGRDFNDRDTVSSPSVAIVNRTFGRKLGLGENPIGRAFRRQAVPSEPEQTFEIVGLVEDTKYLSLREEFGPIAFLCSAQDPHPDPWAQVVIRSVVPMSETSSNIRNVVAQLSPLISVDFSSFETTLFDGLMQERLMAKLSGFFGLLATLIAALGLYGVMSYLVARRTSELGIRIALGAQRRDVLSLVLSNAGLLLVPGLILGAVLSVVVTQAAKAMLFGLKPTDPTVLFAAVAGLGFIAFLASFIPARRATRVDPLVALRYE